MKFQALFFSKNQEKLLSQYLLSAELVLGTSRVDLLYGICSNIFNTFHFFFHK